MNKIIYALIIIFGMASQNAFAIERTLLGEKPDIILLNRDREPVSLQSQINGVKTVLVFWARENSFSTLELNDLLTLTSGEVDFKVIAINVDRQNPSVAQVDSALAFYTSIGLEYPLYFDFGLENFDRLGVTAVPSTFLFDSDGTLIWALAGYLVDNRQSLVDQLLETTPPETTWRSTVNPKAIRYYQLGRVMMQNGEGSMAEVNLNYAASADSSFPDPLIALAELAESYSELIRADSLLNKALRIDSTFVPAFIAKARLAFWDEDVAATANWSAKARAADSTNPLANVLGGWADAMIDSTKLAEEAIERGQITGALNPMVLYVSARVNELLDHKEVAAKMYRKAMELMLRKDY